MDYGFSTLIPPIIAIAFAIAFRKVALALLIGIFFRRTDPVRMESHHRCK